MIAVCSYAVAIDGLDGSFGLMLNRKLQARILWVRLIISLKSP